MPETAAGLAAVLAGLPDPRARRGVRHRLAVVGDCGGVRRGRRLSFVHLDRGVGRRRPGRDRAGVGYRPGPASVGGNDPQTPSGPGPGSAHQGDRCLARRTVGDCAVNGVAGDRRGG